MNQASGTNSTSHSVQEQDPILKCIARELEASFQEIPSNAKPGATVEETAASRALSRGYTFRLESFLTRPRTCSKLFPPKVQKSRYKRITVRERLVLVSVGPTAASAPATEQTIGNNNASQETSQVLIAGLEVLEYDLWPISPTDTSGNADTTEGASISVTAEKMVYIAKVDTSGHWPLLGLDLASRKTPIASPAQALVRGYLKAIRSLDIQLFDSVAHSNNSQGSSESEASSKLSTLSITTPDPHANSSQDLNPPVKSNESEKQQAAAGTLQELHRRTSLYIFARAQPQYLFAESAKNPQKYVLDDRKLVRWWKNMISSVYGQDSSDQDKPSPTMPGQTPKKTQVEAYWHIPGIETERQAANIIRSPISALSSAEASPNEPKMFGWTYGYPDKGAKDLAQGLIPQFPDDPKSRMLQSPSCRRGMVDLRTFWELIAIGEECGAGKITGFFRVVEKNTYQTPPPANNVTKTETKETAEQDSTVDEAIAREQDSTSTGPARAPSGSMSAYTKAINYLLELDFSTLELAQDSTRKWHSKVQTWIQRTSEKSCLHEQEDQVKEVNGQNTDSSAEEKAVSSGDNMPPSPENQGYTVTSPSWIQQLQVQVTLPIVDPSLPKTQSAVSASGSPAPVSPSSTAATSTGTVNFLSPGLIKRKVAPESATQPAPAVNMLSAGLIRRKNPVSDSTPTTSSSSSSTPGATFLDPSLIKRRKVGP